MALAAMKAGGCSSARMRYAAPAAVGSVAINAPMKGPLRSTATEAPTTIAAVSAIFSASSYQNRSSACITRCPACSGESGSPKNALHFLGCPHASPSFSGMVRCGRRATHASPLAGEFHLDRRAALERLIDDTVTLRELEQLIELLLGRIGFHLEAQANLRQADRRVLRHSERTAEIEIAFGGHHAGFKRNVERGRNRLQGDAGTRHQRLKQHVPGTQFQAGAAGRGVKAGNGERPSGLDLARDMRRIEPALCLQGNVGGLRIALVASLERRLHCAQSTRIHTTSFLASTVFSDYIESVERCKMLPIGNSAQTRFLR